MNASFVHRRDTAVLYQQSTSGFYHISSNEYINHRDVTQLHLLNALLQVCVLANVDLKANCNGMYQFIYITIKNDEH